MTTNKPSGTRVVITLRDLGGPAPFINRLRSALKTLLRAFRLRCESVHWDDPTEGDE